jgi:hypothetical protein
MAVPATSKVFFHRDAYLSELKRLENNLALDPPNPILTLRIDSMSDSIVAELNEASEHLERTKALIHTAIKWVGEIVS